MTLPSWEYWQYLSDIFGCPKWWVLLLSNRWSPGMLLNILQCTQDSTARNYPAQNVNNAKCEKLSQIDKATHVCVCRVENSLGGFIICWVYKSNDLVIKSLTGNCIILSTLSLFPMSINNLKNSNSYTNSGLKHEQLLCPVSWMLAGNGITRYANVSRRERRSVWFVADIISILQLQIRGWREEAELIVAGGISSNIYSSLGVTFCWVDSKVCAAC